LRALQGGLLYLLLLLMAMIICGQTNVRSRQNWYGHYLNDSSYLLISISEPPIKKAKSFKAEAKVYAVINGSGFHKTTGKLIIYLSKDDTIGLRYGDRLLIQNKLQSIKNSGNPGAFDYQQYAAFQGIFHSVFLQPGEYRLQAGKDISFWNQFIFKSRAAIVNGLQKYIPGDNRITGIAEALLIGYKQDLDRDLVQAYSNAGVVHIIAISGMHLGLIYVVLVWIFARLPLIKRSTFARVFLILSCLWLFSILTGSSASVLRSAVMFTCIVIGKNFFKQSSAYNSLAASAFILLCYNPYFLWDVGFQLSYLAVFGIMWLQQPIYRRFYFKQRWLDLLWGMVSVTLAAQIVTFPICIYYFNQFPNLFLLTNLLAVPLSTVILFVEIFMLLFAWLPWLASLAGKLTALLISVMNWLIEACNAIPFSMIEMIYATPFTTIILYLLVFAITAWSMYRKRYWLRIALVSSLCFIVLQGVHIFQIQGRRQLIVYNISKHTAIDFVDKKMFLPMMDSALQSDASLQAFNLRVATWL
ncbi:MAG: ComEC family competence protein, partial [Sphingobacteriales bacterium]